MLRYELRAFRNAICWMVAALVSIAAYAFPQSPRDGGASVATSTMSGHVIDAVSGQPLRHAQVRLVRSGAVGATRTTSTDDNGFYEFLSVEAGHYTVTGWKLTYIPMSAGQRHANELGTLIDVGDGRGHDVRNIDIALPRGAVIHGRILDDFGDPGVGAQVFALRLETLNGRRRLLPIASSLTDDLGEFRLFGLVPGQYFVSAMPRVVSANNEADDRRGFAATYYPGTADIASAQRVVVGQVESDISFSLVSARTARVSGIVTDASGGRVGGGVVTALQRTSAVLGFAAVSSGSVSQDGGFSINGLAPGEYVLRVARRSKSDAVSEFAQASVSIASGDIEGVQLVFETPARISGRIVFDSSVGIAPNPSSIHLVAASPDTAHLPGAHSAQIALHDDWSFEVTTAPGRQLIQTTSVGWLVRSVRRNGVAVMDAGLNLRSNEELNNVEVELTNRVPTIVGTVVDQNGQPGARCIVVVFDKIRDRWEPPFDLIRVLRPDENGRFTVTGLPPSEYYAIAITPADPADAKDPDVLQQLINRATSLILNEGDTDALNLKVQAFF